MRGMERLGFPVSIVDFQARFAGDAACLDYLAASRWPQGFTCPACGGSKAWVLARRHLWECAACGRQTSVTAGTVLDHTHTPLTLWFWAAYLVATHTRGSRRCSCSGSWASAAMRRPGSSCTSCAGR